MATAIIRPTSHINYTKVSSYAYKNCEKAYDQNESTLMYAPNASMGAVIFTNFNMTALPNNISKITNIKVCLLADISKTVRAWLCYGATTTEDYTDCGDGMIEIGLKTTKKVYSADFPNATSYWNGNLSAFFNGGLQFRLSYVGKSSSYNIYEAYIEVEYEEQAPQVTVATSVHPEDAGVVIGGGTYESGSTVTLTAMPNSGYAFSHWIMDGVNVGSTNPVSGVITSSTTITAVFAKIETSKVYRGTKKQSVYQGVKKISVYIGTKKIT